MNYTNTRILCVDDEVNVLDAFKRTLRKEFEVFVADGGEQALAMIRTERPFAVILSDMRMPGMNGIQLLGQVKQIAPQTVRMMLTGNSDQQTAIDAVNEGSVFRFLTKPCPPERFTETLLAGLEQYRLITAEKQLLEQTLSRSLQVLLDILSIVNPTAFNRSGRVKKLAKDLAERLKVEKVWEIEFAAMLSQIGCVSVPEDILQKIASNIPLSNKETGLYNRHPQIGYDLVIRIPRMENVAAIILGQNRRFEEDNVNASQVDAPAIGSRILKTVIDYDRFISNGINPHNALRELSERTGWYDPAVILALQRSVDTTADDFESLELGVVDLQPGMYLEGPLVSLRGSTLLPAGQEITTSLILRLANLVETGMVQNRIQVNAPVQRATSIPQGV
ncbi:MAG: HD domain-containing phosphohydrolase [Pyrinomonadaceae bacterium]